MNVRTSRSSRLAEEFHNIRYGSGQATEFDEWGPNTNNLQEKNLAQSDSFGPVEDVSEDFSKMNRRPR